MEKEEEWKIYGWRSIAFEGGYSEGRIFGIGRNIEEARANVKAASFAQDTKWCKISKEIAKDIKAKPISIDFAAFSWGSDYPNS